MKTQYLCLILSLSFAACAAGQTPPPTQPAATATPPPAGPPKRSAADLEKLVAPIALYPDSLIATVLPASVYPLEIVQAARFVADTNNLAKLDEQPWDENVKNVARVPGAIQKLNEDISWTMELGEAFLAQDKDLMDAIQSMRAKAQKAGTLQTTPQQIVTVTNVIIEKTIEQQVVVVTNTVVQIQPSNPTVVYVPTYNPYTVYYPPPAYVYSPAAPLITFGVGMMVGAAIANNNCNWNNGGCYHGGDVNINVNNNNNINVNNNNNINVNNNNNANINRNSNANSSRSTSANQANAAGGQKWQPDQSRLSKSGSPNAANSTRSAEARGYGAGGAKPSTASAAARPSTGTSSASRPTASPSASRSSPTPSASPTRSTPSASPAASRSANRSSSSGSAFGGASSGASASASSSRGVSSRSSVASSGGGGARSGGGGGGGRR